MQPPRRKLSRQSGVSAVEFGLVLPLLLVLLLGLIDYGWVFFVRLNMTNAAREGARVGVTREDPAVARDAAESAARNYLAAAGISTVNTVSATEPDGSADAHVKVTVTVSEAAGTFRPLVGFVPTPPSMMVSAQMRWELAPRGN